MKLVIEQERLKREWTVTYIAKQIGITKSAVSQILHGRIKPSYDVLVKLENLFNMSHQDLFKFTEENTTADVEAVKRSMHRKN